MGDVVVVADSYAQAGVSIDAGNQAVDLYKKSAAIATRPEVIGGLGGFGGFFAMGKYENPVLVAGTDGVGTKLKIAFAMERHDTIGQDLVAMCVNDIVTSGAEPLFFLDYFATGKLSPGQAAQVVDGIARACAEAGCALLGGETAEMPGFYAPGEYDVAGFAVGAVERAALIDGKSVRPGDVAIGVPSSGLHSNGFSLARKVLKADDPGKLREYYPDLGASLGEVLLTPTRLYVKETLALARSGKLLAAAHITGGGLLENVPRVMDAKLGVCFAADKWELPAIYPLMMHRGDIPLLDMYRTFNMGLGMIYLVRPEELAAALQLLAEAGCGDARCVGEVTDGGGVTFE
jgi:phosphoribosylformylglycinamidine cyclo-ligase